ncbi:MAG: ribonuclease P protein component [Gammaproteobacteria bacterium]|nr:MAG: ribonuclease P protein component [Gammaproteobacteria bacterium]RLA22143.1 MAG: ribonuclease P protein component [Gammaproteobacteria bacterium]
MHVEQKDGQDSPVDLIVDRKQFCFQRKLRLTKPAEFKRVFSNPLKSSDRYLTVLYRPNKLVNPRLGLAIPKRNIRRAKDRNRIKRLIREIFRTQQWEIGSFDIVVIAKPQANSCGSVDLSESILSHFKKLWLQKACDA